MRIREGTGRLRAVVRSALVTLTAVGAMCVGSVPALADPGGIGALTVAADPQAITASARAAQANNAYNMAGAKYLIYKDAGCTTPATTAGGGQAVLTVQNNTGTTNTVELVAGTYYVKETNPDLSMGFTGYRISNQVHTLEVEPGNTATITDATEPMVYGTFSLEKGMSNTGSTQTMQGDVSSMAGARYRVRFWTYLYNSADAALADGNVDANVVMQTDAQGRITQAAFEDGSAIVEGSWPFQVGGKNVVPCGTVVVTEESSNSSAFGVDPNKICYQVMDAYLNPSTMKNTGFGPDTVKYVVKSEGKLTKTGHLIVGSDEPMKFGGLEVWKVDNDRDLYLNSGQSTPQGDASLVGIEYTVYNRSDNPVYVRINGCPGIQAGSGDVTGSDGVQYRKFDPNAVILVTKSVEKTTDDDATWYGFTVPDNVLPAGASYEVVETATNESYLLSEWSGEFDFNGSHNLKEDGSGYHAAFNVHYDNEHHNGWDPNPVVRGGVAVHKVDKDSGQSVPQGDATLAGAKFQVTNKSANQVYVDGKWYEVNQPIDTLLTTDDTGTATSASNWLPYGTYEVREVQETDYGYELVDDAVQTFSIRTNGQVVDLGVTSGAFHEPVLTGGFQVQKMDVQSDKPQGDATFEATSFKITNVSENAIWYDADDDGDAEKKVEVNGVVDTIATNEDGIASIDGLSYGTYKITEVAPPEGYRLDSDWSATVKVHPGEADDESGDKVVAVNRNEVIRGGVSGAKIDSTSGDMVSGDSTFAGAGFTIKNVSASEVEVDGRWVKPGEDVNPTNPVIADEDGVWSTAANYLPYGTYEVRETIAPDGYELNTEWRATFTIREDGAIVDLLEQENGSVPDDAVTFSLSVLKTDSDYADFGIVTDESNNLPQGAASLANAEFTVYNASKSSIWYDTDDDGETEEVKPGEVVTVLVSGTDGLTDEITLPYGTYRIRETKAPEGYLLSEQEYVINSNGVVSER